MSGLDLFLSKSLDSTIKNILGEQKLQKVEQRLLEKYGINLTQSIKDFTKLDNVLREFFGEETNRLEKQFLGNVINMQELQAQNLNWITIEDPYLARLLLEILGDEEKKNIIDSVLGEPRTISEILEITKISQTSGYRKVNSLIDSGLLIIHGNISIPDGKLVNKYKAIFENVKIYITKNKVVVKVQLVEESLRHSSVIKVICDIPASKAIVSQRKTQKRLVLTSLNT